MEGKERKERKVKKDTEEARISREVWKRTNHQEKLDKKIEIRSEREEMEESKNI